MARKPRIQIPGGLYHVTARGNTGRVLFRDDADRERFFITLASVSARRGWGCRTYCLLSTHYHLLVETPHANLAAGMQALNSRYAQWTNWSRAERGHIFEARYFSALLESDAHHWELYRYIALNPVRAGLCARPEDWPWSSHAALLGLEPAPPFLDARSTLRGFAPDPAEARIRLRAFVEDAGVTSQRDMGIRAA